MKAHLLIADPRPLFRKGVCDLFAAEPEIASVTEVGTIEELIEQLQSNDGIFVIVHQSLITDISVLPSHQFIMMVSKPNVTRFLEALAHEACGYLRDDVSSDVLKQTLRSVQRECVFDLALAAWIAEIIAEKEASPTKKPAELTQREQEVLALKKEHLSNAQIALKLSITEKTVKKHVQHINEKWQTKLW